MLTLCQLNHANLPFHVWCSHREAHGFWSVQTLLHYDSVCILSMKHRHVKSLYLTVMKETLFHGEVFIL